MVYFARDYVKPFIVQSGYRRLAEIGSNIGLNSDAILEIGDVEMTLIDPCLDLDLVEKYKNDPRVQALKGLSLEVLPTLSESFDAILIDGDHNWYTVFNELKIIRERDLLRPGGAIFFHDTGWPYARRDMYYQPKTIPAEFRHPHARRGIVVGQNELAPEGVSGPGIIGLEHENAIMAGGPRNGVRTAIEDFVDAHPGEYSFQCIEEQHGLGILLRSAPSTKNKVLEKIIRRQMTINRKLANRARLKQYVRTRAPFLVKILKKLLGRS